MGSFVNIRPVLSKTSRRINQLTPSIRKRIKRTIFYQAIPKKSESIAKLLMTWSAMM
jgi:hypothetical protein